MGEIKSTLDLVMARTRHLSLSAEEKESQQRADFEKRLQGLLQQYADGALSADMVSERIAALQAEMKTSDRRIFLSAVVQRIDPDRENARWLDLLAQATPAVCAPLQAALDAYREQQADLLAAGEQDQRERLARQHGIVGPAVVPNPRQDPACRERLAALRRETQASIEALLDQISS